MFLLVSAIIGVLYYHHIFSSVKVEQQSIGPFNYVFFNANQRYDTTNDLWV